MHLITFEALAFQQFTDPAQRPPLLVQPSVRHSSSPAPHGEDEIMDTGLRLPSLLRARPGQKSHLGSFHSDLLSSLLKKSLFKLEVHGDGEERELGG